jgi:hypothetical protein
VVCFKASIAFATPCAAPMSIQSVLPYTKAKGKSAGRLGILCGPRAATAKAPGCKSALTACSPDDDPCQCRYLYESYTNTCTGAKRAKIMHYGRSNEFAERELKPSTENGKTKVEKKEEKTRVLCKRGTAQLHRWCTLCMGIVLGRLTCIRQTRACWGRRRESAERRTRR